MRHVIIGGGAAGITAIESIRESDKESDISLINSEPVALYSRSLLSYFLASIVNEGNLYFRKNDFFARNNIEPMIGVKAERIDTAKKAVITHDKRVIGYDRLLIATGLSGRLPDIPGMEKRGIFAFMTIKDAKEIEATLKRTRSAIVLGDDLVALRAAYALNRRGVIARIVVKSNQVLPRILDEKAAAMIQDAARQSGIEIIIGRHATEILGGHTVEGVLLDDGSKLEGQLVIAAQENVPNIKLATESEIKTDSGIIVDDYMETSHKDIYAAGNAVQTSDITSGESVLNFTWPCAMEQGRIAGMNMAGKKTRYDGLMYMKTIEFFELPVITIGVARKVKDSQEELLYLDENRKIYKKAVLENNIIKGFISVGDVANSKVYDKLIKENADVSGFKGNLLDETFST